MDTSSSSPDRQAGSGYTRRLARAWARVAGAKRGAIAVQTALLMVILIGFAAFAIEITNLLLQQRRMQAAADAAVMAAGTSGRTVAQSTAEAVGLAGTYGFQNGVNTVQVSYNKPPLTGTYPAGSSEVIIQKTFTPQLLRVFSSNNLTIKARAVGSPGRRSAGCILALDTTGSGAVTIRNSSSIQNTSCELVSNSTSATALILENNAKVYGPVYLLGNYQLGIGAAILGTPLLTNAGQATADPYAAVTLPTAPTCTLQSGAISGTTTRNPGHFCTGLTLANNANLTLTTGVYFIDSALSFGNNSSLTATSGVTLIINTATTVTIGNNVVMQITAPLTGTTAGLALASQRGVTGTFGVSNGASLQVNGAIYMPSMTFRISGNAITTGSPCTQLIGNRLDLGSNINLQADCSGTAVLPIGRVQPVLIE